MSELLNSFKPEKQIPDKEAILNLVDDYTLFCFYLNDEVYINQVILSPLRNPETDQVDSLPSFTIYESRYNKLRFFDHGKGDKGGDIFDLVQEMYGLSSFKEACVKISKDFGLNLYPGEASTPDPTAVAFLAPGKKTKPKAEIKNIVSHPEMTTLGKAFWNQYYLTPEILREYNVTQVRSLITNRNITTYRKEALVFAYRIGNKYKIYSPKDTDFKFMNNYPSDYVEGLFQLVQRGSDNKLLIITKSTKDVMVLRLLGYDAISPKGENILIPGQTLEKLKLQFKRVVLFFDNDKAGIKGVGKYAVHNFENIWIPDFYRAKDISDFIAKFGPQKAYDLLLDLLH